MDNYILIKYFYIKIIYLRYIKIEKKNNKYNIKKTNCKLRKKQNDKFNIYICYIDIFVTITQNGNSNFL